MPTFKVPVEFIFKGAFVINADNRLQAEEFVEKHCGMSSCSGIHSSLPEEQVDWDFPMHPDKKIRRSKKVGA